MAKITPGAIISEISGSIAGTTYARNKGGLYAKSKLIQTNPDSTEQQASRAITSAAVAAWQALPPEEQQAWNVFAQTQLSRPRISLRSQLTGYNSFVRLYNVRNTYGLSGNPSRLEQQPLGNYSNFNFEITDSAITLELDGDNTNADVMAVAKLSGPWSPGRSSIPPSSLTRMDYDTAPNGPLSFDLTSAWVAKWGALTGSINQKIFARIEIVNRTTGQVLAVFRSSAIVPFTPILAAVAASGSGNRVMTSPDGITWTSRTSAANNSWLEIAWSPSLGLFASVAQSGSGDRVMTSPDGITWTSRTSATDNDWRHIAWSPSLGLFVAVAISGTGDRVMTSPDGIAWTSRTSAADNQWNSIAWSPSLSLFVAVAITGSGDRVMTSPDGINWTIRTSAADNSWNAIVWSPSLSLFAAVSSSGTGDRVMTSPDGINWTSRTSAANNEWRGITWSPSLGLFIAVAGTGVTNRVMTSPDGINWTIRTSAADLNWRAVTSNE